MRRPALAVAVLLAALVPAAPAAAGPRSRLTVARASADAGVQADRPGEGAGRAHRLRIDGAPVARAYLRFRLSGLRGRVVTSAWLWVHLPQREAWGGLTASATDGRAWRESRLTWRRRPAVTLAGGTARRAGGAWRKLDVTTLVKTNGTLDLVLTTASRRAVLLQSREAGRTVAPRLRIRSSPDTQPRLPVTAALYRGDHPAAWREGSHYHPAAGAYDGAAGPVIARQLGDLSFGGVEAAITPWGGPGSPGDIRARALLATTRFTRSAVRWVLAPNAETLGDPSPARIAALLAALDRRHGRDAAYLRLQGRPVVFIPTETEDTCAAARRWVAGNRQERFYLVMQATSDYRSCAGRPSDWYATDARTRLEQIPGESAAISPGAFAPSDQTAELARDLPAWYAAVRGLRAAAVRWRLVDSYDGWDDGSAVEPATEWRSRSGHGAYLDALHAGGVPPATPNVPVVAAGDIACGAAQQAANKSSTTCQSAATSFLTGSLHPAAVLALGDLAYPQGALGDFRATYDHTWGAFKAITYPVPGNHEYCDGDCADPAGAARAGYFTYFGARAHHPEAGWYSFDLGSWHVVALNSECNYQGGCDASSPMARWLRADLAANPQPCTLAFWHRPRFSGGHEGEAPSMDPIWQILYQNGVELVLNGHEHMYERFLPQTPGRAVDASGGITEIVAGTGGRSHIVPITTRANTAAENHDTFGVLGLDLEPLGYQWRFVPAPGLGTFSDAGAADCH